MGSLLLVLLSQFTFHLPSLFQACFSKHAYWMLGFAQRCYETFWSQVSPQIVMQTMTCKVGRQRMDWFYEQEEMACQKEDPPTF
ncbi:hypothetical protein C8J56DRAFT_972993, partial [Mycena floridula]